LSFISKGNLVLYVEDNSTSMQLTTEELFSNQLNHDSPKKSSNIIRVRSYAEAVGILTAHREGLLIESISPNVSPLSLK